MASEAAPTPDAAADVDARCQGVFTRFRAQVHAGDTAAHVRSVLGSTSWIGSDEPVDVLGGEVPVAMTQADQTVVVMCLPKPDARADGRPWSPWVIYMRLEGRDSKTFAAFLARGGDKKLIEYALCHAPDGQHMTIDRVR